MSNDNYYDKGHKTLRPLPTERMHVRVATVQYIGTPRSITPALRAPYLESVQTSVIHSDTHPKLLSRKTSSKTSVIATTPTDGFVNIISFQKV